VSVISGVALRDVSQQLAPPPDMVELAEDSSESARVKSAHEMRNKSVPNHFYCHQINSTCRLEEETRVIKATRPR